jgi:predicted ATPase
MAMMVSHIELKNWRNFLNVGVPIGERMFLVGPNASGKSNFLDALRFLRDVAKREGGGLQKATSDRGGLSKIRCLAARRYPNVEIDVTLSEVGNSQQRWRYAIGIKREAGGKNQTVLAYEKVWRNGKQIINRPDKQDEQDRVRLTQTYLEQINANVEFREIVTFFEAISYLHMVPQLLKYPEVFGNSTEIEDSFGRGLLDDIARLNQKQRQARLRKIEQALRIAVPQLKQLSNVRDESGVPHLEAVYEHWRPQGAKQREDQFSDGTLRLIGLLWSLLKGEATLLLEEPELSLNSGIVAHIPTMIYRILRDSKKKRQVIISTHSAELLSDLSISGDEVLLLTPSAEGTEVSLASSIEEVRHLLEAGVSVADAVLPRTSPKRVEQLGLFG